MPPGDPACFLVTATLRLTGSELAPTDVSQFVLGADGQWKLSHNVQVTQPSLVVARSIDGRPATGRHRPDETSRRALAGEVFARSIGSSTGNRSSSRRACCWTASSPAVGRSTGSSSPVPAERCSGRWTGPSGPTARSRCRPAR
ncbi:hypothetical protein NKG94_01885 [Micromonospora sp. M12]